MNCGEWTATGLQLSCSVAWSRLAGNSFCLIPLPHRASNVSWWQLGMAEVSLPDHLPQPCDVPVKRTRNTCPLSTTNASMLGIARHCSRGTVAFARCASQHGGSPRAAPWPAPASMTSSMLLLQQGDAQNPSRQQRRPLTNAAACDSVWPVCQLQGGLEALQAATGLPWWACIVGATVALRTVVTLPLATNQHRRMARAELLAPTLKQWSEAIAHKVVAQCRQQNKSHEEANKIATAEVLACGNHAPSRYPGPVALSSTLTVAYPLALSSSFPSPKQQYRPCCDTTTKRWLVHGTGRCGRHCVDTHLGVGGRTA